MTRKSVLLALTVSVAALAGCAQQEETVILPEPTFDKYGNQTGSECPVGTDLVGDVCELAS